MAGMLPYLTQADERALVESARTVDFDDGAVILAQGQRPRALFVLRRGSAMVERSYDAYSLTVSELQEGEVFGEIGFVDESPASASVVARGTCEVQVIDEALIRALVMQDAGFGERFYRSIARILSARLRATTAQGLSEFSWGSGFGLAQPQAGEAPAGWGGGSPLRNDEE